MVVLAVCLSVGVVTARANNPPVAKFAESQNQDTRRELPSDVKNRMRRAVATVGLILVSDGGGDRPRPRGSGVIVRQDGVIVTNWHVIKQGDLEKPFAEIYFSITPESGAAPLQSAPYRLRVVEFDQRLDLALLRVLQDNKADSGPQATALTLPFIEIGDSRAIELLDDLVIIGFPQTGGATATLSRGIVEGKDDSEGWIKTDARLLHGNSGGAAVNAEGKLIGIATKVEVDHVQNGIQLGSVGYLRPAHFVAQMLDKMRDREKAALVKVKGTVKFAVDGRPIAGARVGLILAGREVAPESLVTWGGTNADGYFQLEKPVPPGKYTLRAKVVGDERYAVYNQEIEIKPDFSTLVIEMQAAKMR